MNYDNTDYSVTTVFSSYVNGYRIFVNRTDLRFKNKTFSFYSTFFPGFEIHSRFRPHLNIEELPNHLGKISFNTDLLTHIKMDGCDVVLLDVSDEDIRFYEDVENNLIKVYDDKIYKNFVKMIKEA